VGSVLARWRASEIDGCRKRLEEVAAFHFAAPSNRYAVPTRLPDHYGRSNTRTWSPAVSNRRRLRRIRFLSLSCRVAMLGALGLLASGASKSKSASIEHWRCVGSKTQAHP